MRKEGQVVPVENRRCMSPIYDFASKAVARKGVGAVLHDLKKPPEGQRGSPLFERLKIIREGYKVTGKLLSPIGQEIRKVATSTTAVKGAVIFEGLVQKLEKKTGKELPHFEDVARTIVWLGGGIFGAETKEIRRAETFDGIYVNPENNGRYNEDSQGEKYGNVPQPDGTQLD